MDYIDLFTKTNLSKMQTPSLVATMFLIGARLAPIVGLAPFFGARVLPHTSKVLLCLCLIVIILPKVAVSISGPVYFDTNLIFLFLKELFIGLILGFFLTLPFLILSSSGVLIDHQRGAASLMTNDPTIQNQSSPIGTLFNFLLIVLFYAVDGPFFVIDTVFESYDLVAPDKFLSPLFFIAESPLKHRIDSSLNVFFSLMLQFAMPSLLLILMTDAFLGIINRLAPQVQITFLGMGLKSWLSLFMLCLGWSPFLEYTAKQITSWLQEFYIMIHEIAVGVA